MAQIIVELIRRNVDGSLTPLGPKEIASLPAPGERFEIGGDIVVVEAVGPAHSESSVDTAVCFRLATNREALEFRSELGRRVIERILDGDGTVTRDDEKAAKRAIDEWGRFQAREAASVAAALRAGKAGMPEVDDLMRRVFGPSNKGNNK